MTDPKLEPVSVITSLAHRSGDAVRVVIHLPGLDLPAGEALLRCVEPGGRRVRVPGTVTVAEAGVHVEALIPAARLRGAVWRLAVKAAGTDVWVPVEARLLANRRQPIALLPGPRPVTRMPEPVPVAPTRSTKSSVAKLATRATGLRRRVEARLRR